MNYNEFVQELQKFTAERGWNQYHNLKDLAVSLNLEASEVLEIFQWKDTSAQLTSHETKQLEMELADVFIYLIYMCDKLGVSPLELAQKKQGINHSRHWKLDENLNL